MHYFFGGGRVEIGGMLCTHLSIDVIIALLHMTHSFWYSLIVSLPLNLMAVAYNYNL